MLGSMGVSPTFSSEAEGVVPPRFAGSFLSAWTMGTSEKSIVSVSTTENRRFHECFMLSLLFLLVFICTRRLGSFSGPPRRDHIPGKIRIL